jgi:hypothetical protein
MGDEPAEGDILEQGGRQFRLPGWRPSRGAGIFAVAALVVGLAAGYAAGDQHARGKAALQVPTAAASPSSLPAPGSIATFSFANSPALIQDTGACSEQSGRQLELGIQLTNQSSEVLSLQTVKAVLPLGGLKQVTWQWATCGAIPSGLGNVATILSPGQSTWLSVMLQVNVHCPGPLPVQFSVGYLVQGHTVTASLPGFPDLSQVPYSGCQPQNTGSNVSAESTKAP